MKLATWNVNGIRARHAQVHEWIERDRPDVVCLQEIKATSDQVPTALCEMQGYWCHWHGGKGYSGVALHVSKTLVARTPHVSPPRLRLRTAASSTVDIGDLTIASVYVPNGGKDFPGEDGVSGSAWTRTPQRVQGDGTPARRCCGDMNVARTERDVHPEGAEAARDRPTARGARG